MIASLVLCGGFCGGTAAVAGAQCTGIDGHKLIIRSAQGNRRSKLNWKARDNNASFLISDPSQGTTSIDILADGVSVLALSFPAASAPAWKSSGNPVRQWKYNARNDPAPTAGIDRVNSRGNRFQLKGSEGVIDSIVAPLALPITTRVTDSSGACYEAQFSVCTRNDSRTIRCKAEPGNNVCMGTGTLHAATVTDRSVALDLNNFTPYPQPNPLRSLNMAQLHFQVGKRVPTLDEAFGSNAEIPGGRNVRVWFSRKSWPAYGFDNPVDCRYDGVQTDPNTTPRLDRVITDLAAQGDNIMLVLPDTPASLSVDCDPQTCAGHMTRGNGCTCLHPGGGTSGYSSFPPRQDAASQQAVRDFWGCVFTHYAALGVRRFEIWNEPVGTFSPDPDDRPPNPPTGTQKQFLRMFEQIRTALEAKRGNSSAIEIGGPAVSRKDAAFAGNGPLLPALLNAVDKDNGGKLDFVSFHMYVADPGGPFATGLIDDVRSYIPGGWRNTGLYVDEWQTALRTHVCRLGPDGISAPEGAVDGDPGTLCDHRGAGYAAYSLTGFLTAGLANGNDVTPYVFDMFERDDLAPDDFYITDMGVMTAHVLPKPEAQALWAASQMRDKLLGGSIETLSDRSFAWMAANDENGVTHVLLSQFDSDENMHFTRSFRAAGFDPDDLIIPCGCDTSSDPNQCLKDAVIVLAGTPIDERSGALAARCPTLDDQRSAAVLAGLQAYDARKLVRGTPLTVGVSLDGLPCGRHQVDLYRMGPGTTTTELFRAAHPAPAFFGEFNTRYTNADWLDLQAQLWNFTKTPTESYTAIVGQTLPAITIPAYGAVYLRIQ